MVKYEMKEEIESGRLDMRIKNQIKFIGLIFIN